MNIETMTDAIWDAMVLAHKTKACKPEDCKTLVLLKRDDFIPAATAAIAAVQSAAPEIRRNDDGTLDEIVAGNCKLHLEKMDKNAWWIGIIQGGRHVSIWLRAKGKITAYMEESPELPPAPSQGEG